MWVWCGFGVGHWGLGIGEFGFGAVDIVPILSICCGYSLQSFSPQYGGQKGFPLLSASLRTFYLYWAFIGVVDISEGFIASRSYSEKVLINNKREKDFFTEAKVSW
jgi:hypothetical protein